LLEGRYRTEICASLEQPQPGAAGILVVLVPWQKQLEAVGVARHMFERQPRYLARPQRRAERDGDMMQYLVILLKGQTFLPRIG